MKKITIFILTIFTMATLFAAARPSLDGRAVVADSGTMPRGLFARTVGYLPGDSVTVTNPATGSSVDVLILGSIDPSEGVAILLSPESAEALRIKPNSNVQVKLTKRAGSLDENANGSAVLSEGDESPAVSEEAPAETVEETPAVSEEAPAEEKPAEAVEESPAVLEEAPAVSEEAPAETVEESPAVLEEAPAEEKPAEAVEETPVVPEEAPVEEKAEPDAVYEEVPPLPQELEKVEDEELPVEDDKLQKVILVPGEEETVENPVEEEAVPESVEEETPAGIEAEPDVVVEEPVQEEEKTDEYQPIILVPAEPNPPVEEKTEVVEDEDEVEKLPVVENPVVTNSWENFVVPSLKNLKSSYYYVQIASLSDIENIKNIIDKYSSKYPIVLVQNSSKTAYQVMVGPLNVDEYGSVAEKFKAYGFKDSFLRKIK